MISCRRLNSLNSKATDTLTNPYSMRIVKDEGRTDTLPYIAFDQLTNSLSGMRQSFRVTDYNNHTAFSYSRCWIMLINTLAASALGCWAFSGARLKWRRLPLSAKLRMKAVRIAAFVPIFLYAGYEGLDFSASVRGHSVNFIPSLRLSGAAGIHQSAQDADQLSGSGGHRGADSFSDADSGPPRGFAADPDRGGRAVGIAPSSLAGTRQYEALLKLRLEDPELIQLIFQSNAKNEYTEGSINMIVRFYQGQGYSDFYVNFHRIKSRRWKRY